jgi:hypothetical protein
MYQYEDKSDSPFGVKRAKLQELIIGERKSAEAA